MQRAGLLRELWQRQRHWLLAVGILLTVNLGLFVVLQQFLVPRVVEREQRFIQRQDQARQLLRESGGFADTPEQHFVRVRQDIARFQSIVPEHEEFTGLIDELLVLAYRADLNIRQIVYDTEDLAEVDLRQYDLSFSVTGSYENLKQFIHALEQSPRIMAIRQIELNTLDRENAEDGSLRLILQTVFRFEAGKA
ncbi:MAG TPA: type 4a pilus biogenesis protein PilO [Desulfuromonadales bacterium]|nr:type 4a pilus biogenesis protein PilO [Desulfuromonadales bacterium]